MTPEPSERSTCLRGDAAEELAEERIGHERIAVLDDARGVDVHHRRRHPLHDRREGELKLGGRARHPALLRARAAAAMPKAQEDGGSECRGDAQMLAWKNPESMRPDIGTRPRL